MKRIQGKYLSASWLRDASNDCAFGIIEAVHDLLARPTAVEELWHKWEKPDIWRVPHGHFSFSLIGAPGLMAHRVLGWLAMRLDKRVIQQNASARDAAAKGSPVYD